ncbi:MAG: NAD(P)-dependent oxidoreductase [Planctomycetaceae bacterium]
MNCDPPDDGSATVYGLIGIGLMGTALAERLLAAGMPVLGWDVSADRRAALLQIGGRCAASLDQVFSRCDRIVLSLPSHETVSLVLDNAAASIRAGQIIVDTSTGDPAAAVAQAAKLAERDVEYLDATISGSSQQLREGTAVFLVGGNTTTFEQCRGLFATLTSKSFHTGPAGSGARMKLVTNLVLGLNRAALAEGISFAHQLGLDLNQALFLLRESMAYSRIMDTKGEKMLSGDFSPQARLSQHLKDVRLMLQSAHEANGSLPLTETHRVLLERAVEMGFGDLDNSAIVRAIAGNDFPAS